MKVCSRCKLEKADDQFRLRYDKRGKGSAALKYLNNTCRQCDAEISNRHYFKNKGNSDFYKNWISKSRDNAIPFLESVVQQKESLAA